MSFWERSVGKRYDVGNSSILNVHQKKYILQLTEFSQHFCVKILTGCIMAYSSMKTLKCQMKFEFLFRICTRTQKNKETLQKLNYYFLFSNTDLTHRTIRCYFSQYSLPVSTVATFVRLTCKHRGRDLSYVVWL